MRLKQFFIYSFFKHVYRRSSTPWFLRFNIGQFFPLLLVNYDSGWYGVAPFGSGPRLCVFSPQHDDTRVT